jgi:SAM-dependent methyltransferase
MRTGVNVPKSIFEFNDYNRDRFIEGFARDLPSGARVLDAGAGTCRYRPLFSHCDYKSQDFARYQGTELKYGEIDYISDITEIPVPDGSFDAVLCSEVLEHVPRPDQAVRELARALKPDGRLALTAPLMSGLHLVPYHFCSGFSPYWYQHFLPQFGLKIESCRANGGFFGFYGQESRRFLHRITPENPVLRGLFFPLKLLLALWFRLAMPVACHFLDRFDRDPDITVGYFVIARKTAAGPRTS